MKVVLLAVIIWVLWVLVATRLEIRIRPLSADGGQQAQSTCQLNWHRLGVPTPGQTMTLDVLVEYLPAVKCFSRPPLCRPEADAAAAALALSACLAFRMPSMVRCPQAPILIIKASIVYDFVIPKSPSTP